MACAIYVPLKHPFLKMLGSSLVTAQLAASEEGLSSMELAS
jgi:hypothetical protein